MGNRCVCSSRSPTSDGSACAILCSEEFAKKHGLTDKAVEILAIEMATDLPSTFKEQSCMKMVSHESKPTPLCIVYIQCSLLWNGDTL